MTLHVPNLSVPANTAPESPARAVTHFPAPPSLYRSFFKRTIDVTFVLLSTPVVLPLIVVLTLLVALLTGGQPFYTQQRVGRHGKVFRMWKLRTMVKNADVLLENHLRENPAAREEWDRTQKLKNDPRITTLGRLLRKTSADELPQLFNVLNGTMSLVGPRPMMVEQKAQYHGTAYYDMRPGITGLWQVSDRNECSFKERVTYDNSYNRALSLKTDMGILFKTITVVILATGH